MTLRLSLSPMGRLLLHRDETFVEVTPVRAFPIDAPDSCIALVGPDGREAVWLPTLDALPEQDRSLLLQALDRRGVMPEIRRLVAVSTFSTPSRWTVETDRGPTVFVLNSEDSIRRYGRDSLLISDSVGMTYFVRDMGALDPAGRRLLDRFL